MGRPQLVRKSLRLAFYLNEKMLSYYCSILDCPMCITNLSGFWKVRMQELFDGAISWIRHYGSREDFCQLLAMPSEVEEVIWMPYFQKMFSLYKKRNCHALSVIVNERLMEKTYIPTKRAAQQDEPTQQDGEEEICHA